jgi:hypothetical protein
MNGTSEITARPRAIATWDLPAEPAAPKVLLASGIAGLSGAIALPGKASGLGYLVVALVCAACTWFVMGRVKALSAAWGALSLALVAVTVIRDAYWLYVLCILAACVAGSLAVAGGKSVGGLLLGASAVTLGAVVAIPWVARGLLALRRKATRQSGRVTRSVLVSLGLLAVFVPLLAGADAAFANILSFAMPTVNSSWAAQRILLFLLVGLGLAGAALAVTAPPPQPEPVARRRSLSIVEWAMPVGILVLLFTVFGLVQLTTLFGGSRYVLDTSGMTYAVYARSGFWQLLVVTILTLGVVAAAARWASRETAKDRLWLRGLLGALSVLMLVVVASALTRMWTYQQAYGFTVQRVLVEACELWLGVVYLLVIGAGVRLGAGWLPRAIVGSGLAGLLVFAWLDPERVIAAHNVTRWQQTQEIDTEYLSRLSADAAPELSRLPENLRPCLERDDDHDWRDWNLSRARLGQEAAQQGCRAF